MKVYHRTKKYVFIALYAFMLFLAFGLGQLFPQIGANKPSSAAKVVTQNAVLKSEAQKLGLDVSGVDLEFSSELTPRAVDGTYSDNSIKILTGISGKQLDVLMSHEYMHHVWKHLDPSSSSKQSDYLYTLLMQNKGMQERVRSYFNEGFCGDGPCDLLNEVNAYACTEVPSSVLSPDYLAYCEKWLPQRALLVN